MVKIDLEKNPEGSISRVLSFVTVLERFLELKISE